MRNYSLVLLLAGATTCGSPTGPGQSYDQLTARLEQILADSAAANGVIGAQAVVRIPGRAPWVGVYGLNGVADSMRPDLLIGTGSISKMYTAAAALVLIDRGVIHLSDTVGRWFPATPNVAPSITLKQLLEHTSGLADYGANPAFSQALLGDLQRTWLPTELLPYVQAPLFPPGTGWNASNTNRLLLGLIVEQESGMSLGAFMRSELFPSTSGSWLSGDGQPSGPIATQWSTDQSGHRFDFSATFFGPAIFSTRREVQNTTSDLAAFSERLFAGDLLSPATRAAMLTIVPDDGAIPGQTGGGLGIRRYNYLGRALYGHSGATANSTALVLYDPATGIIAAVSVNQDGGSHKQSHFRTTPALLQAAISYLKP